MFLIARERYLQMKKVTAPSTHGGYLLLRIAQSHYSSNKDLEVVGGLVERAEGTVREWKLNRKNFCYSLHVKTTDLSTDLTDKCVDL